MAGAGVAPTVYQVLRAVGVSSVASGVGGVLVLSNQVLLTDSRFISPNPIMILASLLALYFTCTSTRAASQSLPGYLPADIWSYLNIGLLLGVAISTLHLGFVSYLFLAGFIAVREFGKFGDVTRSERELWGGYLKRVGVVVVLPWLVYYLCYAMVVGAGTRSGASDKYLSVPFQVSIALVFISVGIRELYPLRARS